MRLAELVELAADPDGLDSLAEEDLANVLASLEELRVRLWIRLSRRSEPATNCGRPEPEPDRMLEVEDVADVLSCTKRYVYDHADEWPFTRRISPRKLRFSERGLYRWLETRP